MNNVDQIFDTQGRNDGKGGHRGVLYYQKMLEESKDNPEELEMIIDYIIRFEPDSIFDILEFNTPI